MAVNLATKYSDRIASYFTLKSVVDGNTNNDYDFNGAASIQVYTPVTRPLENYTRSGANRYGTPSEMQDNIQELTLERDRSFAVTIDRGNNNEQMGVKEAGKMLSLELDEQVIPEMDKYALQKFADNAGTVEISVESITKDNIVAKLANAMTVLSNKNVPNSDRVIYLGWTYFGALRMSSDFIGNDLLGTAVLKNGAIGSFMGAAVVPVPDGYLKKGSSVCYFLITHKNSVIQPKTIQDYFVKQNPPGINGALLEGRFRYDAFVLGSKADGVYACVATGSGAAIPTFSYTAATKTMTVTCSGATAIRYTLDETDPRYSKTAVRVSGGMIGISLSAYAGSTVKIKASADGGTTLFSSGVGSTSQAVASAT